MALDMASGQYVIVWMKLRLKQGTRNTSHQKKQGEVRLQEAEKRRLIFPFVQTNPLSPGLSCLLY